MHGNVEKRAVDVSSVIFLQRHILMLREGSSGVTFVTFLKQKVEGQVPEVNWVDGKVSAAVKRTMKFKVTGVVHQQELSLSQQSGSKSQSSNSYVPSQPSQKSIEYQFEDAKRRFVVDESGDISMVRTRSTADPTLTSSSTCTASLLPRVVQPMSKDKVESDSKKVLKNALSAMLAKFISEWNNINLAKRIIALHASSANSRRLAVWKCFLYAVTLPEVITAVDEVMSLGGSRYLQLKERLKEFTVDEIKEVEPDWVEVLSNVSLRSDCQCFLLPALIKVEDGEKLHGQNEIDFGC
ncbi:hypothetical protein MP228_011518 [Amoeboaphelidium protococcarum]|nr:hypothetical protein MP228_011518 [Amoeboaphelidium protococcarum]